MDFSSDNTAGASPEVLRAIVGANGGTAPPYGKDSWTDRAVERLSAAFERPLAAFLVATGTASNALALAALAPPGTAVFCHEEAHVAEDECGAPEFFTAGCKIVGVPGPAGKMGPDGLTAVLGRFPRGIVRQAQPAALSLSQVTEAGTLYAAAEVRALADLAHGAGLGVHMDGARFANAVAALGCTPADITWRAGVDVLSLGATKGGALACEAVVFFDPERARDFSFRRKRGGHTVSKGRLLGAQLDAYLADGHWLELARRANARAARLAAALAALPGVRLPWPAQANEVFPIVPAAMDAALRAAGALYHPWTTRSLPAADAPGSGEAMLRLVCSFATAEAEVERFLDIAGTAALRADRSR